jgi:hypothetical protein
MTDDLLAELLAKPIGPNIPTRPTHERDFTRQVEVRGDTAAVTVRGATGEVTEDAATAYLRAQGLDPDGWTVTGFRSSTWTMPNGNDGVSTRYTFARTSATDTSGVPLDELLASVQVHQPNAARPDGDHGYLVLLGDMQFGKIDGDGAPARCTARSAASTGPPTSSWSTASGTTSATSTWAGSATTSKVSSRRPAPTRGVHRCR